MKKLLLLIFFVFSLFLCFSQEESLRMRAYEADYGVWDAYKKKFNFLKQPVKTDLTFTITNNKVTCNDEAKSIYTFIKKDDDKDDDELRILSYKAFDEKYRSCTIAFSNNKVTGIKHIIILYEKTCFIYLVRLIDL